MATLNISLADLSEDIAGAIPSDIVLGWNGHEKTSEIHAQLLEPYRARGTIASSDSAGLSRLTQRYSLAQVMKLISEPKEVIHAYGTAIGGEAIGVWAADNSQMFYPEPIDPARVVTQMLAVQRDARPLAVQIGIGIHSCECYRIAGGLFGEGADFIETIAEDDTAGGEIVVSEKVLGTLSPEVRAIARHREDLADRGTLWSISNYQGPLDGFICGDDRKYPTPFDEAFFARLKTSNLEELAAATFKEYSQSKTVAFIKVPQREHSFLLDSFTAMSLADLTIRRVASSHGADVVKSTGALAIALFDAPEAAVAFARDVIETTRRLGCEARIGITYGEVYLFPLRGGCREIAGNAVNIGSKLSEDSGMNGILVESSVLLPTNALGACHEPFRTTISRVEIQGQRVVV